MFERFSDRARRVLLRARNEAGSLGHDYLGTEHLLLGLLAEGEGLAWRALSHAGVSLDAARSKVPEVTPELRTSGVGDFTAEAKRAMTDALREGLARGHNHIGTEHLLLGLLNADDNRAVTVLRMLNVQPGRLVDEVRRILGTVEQEGRATRTTFILPTVEQIARPDSHLAQCSFCTRLPPDSGRLVAGKPVRGRTVFMCEHCVNYWAEAFGDPGKDQSAS